MADFQQMGGVPDFYTQLLTAAQQQLVRMPDGTLAPAPQYGQATSVNDLYKGIIPAESPLVSRRVTTVPVDGLGNPVVAQGPQSRGSGNRRAVTEGVQPAGSVQLPAGVRPSAVDAAFASMGASPQTRMPFPKPLFPVQVDSMGRYNASPAPILGYGNKDQSRLPKDSAQQAIELALGIGPVSPRMPMARPAALLSAPVMPMPRPASPGMVGSSYTVRRGDTLSQLARQFNTSVNALSSLNNIRDPNRIQAGSTLRIPNVASVLRSGATKVSTPAPQQQSSQGEYSATGRLLSSIPASQRWAADFM